MGEAADAGRRGAIGQTEPPDSCYSGRVRYPTRIRLDHDAYRVRTTTFHGTVHAHPTVPRWSPLVGESIWRTVLEQRDRPRIELLAACLMPDHIHLLLRPCDGSVLDFLRTWKSWSTRQAWRAGHSGTLWQPGMWDRTVRDFDDYVATRAYVLNNPVADGLVEHVEDWPWSWAQELEA